MICSMLTLQYYFRFAIPSCKYSFIIPIFRTQKMFTPQFHIIVLFETKHLARSLWLHCIRKVDRRRQSMKPTCAHVVFLLTASCVSVWLSWRKIWKYVLYQRSNKKKIILRLLTYLVEKMKFRGLSSGQLQRSYPDPAFAASPGGTEIRTWNLLVVGRVLYHRAISPPLSYLLECAIEISSKLI